MKKENSISGQIDKVVAFSPESGWSVLRVSVDGGSQETVVGCVVQADEGLRIEAEGQWAPHPQFGPQFKATSTRIFEPQGVAGIQRFLSSGAITGVGPVYAKKIVNTFQERTLDVIRKDPGQLKFIKGVGQKRIKAVITGVREYQDVLEVMSFLHQRFGIVRANKIFGKYGKEAKKILEKDPYRLVSEIDGIGFALADEVGRDVGMTDDHPQRLKAGTMAVLERAAQSGHTCVDEAYCVSHIEAVLGGEGERGRRALEEGLKSGQVSKTERDGRTFYELEKYRWLEQRVITRLGVLLSTARTSPAIDASKAIPWAEQRVGLSFEEDQAAAIRLALENKVAIITGGPGVGKTTLLNGLLQILAAKQQRVLLAAPTGRAARRMSESTGTKAETIHKLLDAQPGRGGFQFNGNRRLSADTVVIDEQSMVDLSLMRALLEALPDSANLVMVGDKDQLPSVGPGQVLADLIDSAQLPVARLTRPFRQAAGSPIILNAHAVNAGEMPDLYGGGEAFRFVETSDAQATAAAVVDCVCRQMVAAGYRPMEDVMTLVPMNRGPVGVEAINQALQVRLNPNPPDAIERGGRRYGLGDRVIQRRNDRDLGVFNGDLGRIESINRTGKALDVDFEGRKVSYPFGSLSALHLAYAITVHRAQGAEWPACVVVVDTSNSILLDRKLLYTALTRAKSNVVLIGQRRAVHISVSEARANLRSTHLGWRLAAGLCAGNTMDLSKIDAAVV